MRRSSIFISPTRYLKKASFYSSRTYCIGHTKRARSHALFQRSLGAYWHVVIIFESCHYSRVAVKNETMYICDDMYDRVNCYNLTFAFWYTISESGAVSIVATTLRQPCWNQCKNQMHPRFILRICTSEALYLEIDILPSLIETCCADASIQWILPRRSKDHNLSLHNIIILANEARGESACIMYASFPSQMSIRDVNPRSSYHHHSRRVFLFPTETHRGYHALRPTHETVWKKIIIFLKTDKTSSLLHTRSRSPFVTNVYCP